MLARDYQRSKVYSAEQQFRAVLDHQGTSFRAWGSTFDVPREIKFGRVEDVQRYVDELLDLSWVQERWPRMAAQGIRVRPRRGALQAHYESGGVIAIPEHRGGLSWAMREVVVLHEVAHHLTVGDRHGPQFVSALTLLVRQIMGFEAGVILTAFFDQNGVEFHQPGRMLA